MVWARYEGGLAPRSRTGGIAWREVGQGPPVLLIHSVGLNADAWEPVMVGLADRRRVIAPDLPGHGQSELLSEDAGLADFVAATARLIDALGLSPVPVVGHSFGAMIALGLVLEFPKKVASLVALNPIHCRDPLARATVEGRARRLTGTTIDVIETIARWFPDDPNGMLARRVANWLRACNPKGYATAYRVFASADRAYEGRLGGLACRALFMTGVADPHATPAMSEHMAHEAPHAHSVALPRARHMMPMTHPAETTGAIMAFLSAAQPKG